jgi:hypothetical protein
MEHSSALSIPLTHKCGWKTAVGGSLFSKKTNKNKRMVGTADVVGAETLFGPYVNHVSATRMWAPYDKSFFIMMNFVSFFVLRCFYLVSADSRTVALCYYI